jgi:hypothetical protein
MVEALGPDAVTADLPHLIRLSEEHPEWSTINAGTHQKPVA